MASQQDVAKRARVSFMTVSRVVNNHPGVKSETRERVLSAIRELAYYPNAAARTLNGRGTRNIGMIFPHKEFVLSRPFFIELCVELESHLSDTGYHLFLGSVRKETGSLDLTVLFKERKVDGLVIFAPERDDESVKRLAAEGLPFIVVHGRSDAVEYSYVDIDNERGVSRIMRYLFDLGHRRIGFVSGNMEEVNAQDRSACYRRELEAVGVGFDERIVHTGDWSLESGYEGFRALVGRAPAPSAIVFSNDQMALGAIKAAHDLGVSIPGDVSITGYDDIKYASFVVPALTTMRQPLDRVGEAVATLILERLDGRSECRRVILEPEFKIRDSCGPARAGGSPP